LKGTTKLMLTRIPFYRDVIISSFICDHCNCKDTGIESANAVKDKGMNMSLLVKNKDDLNREVIKSDFATLEIPEIEFEIPAKTQKSC
jgi:zinc finger protein